MSNTLPRPRKETKRLADGRVVQLPLEAVEGPVHVPAHDPMTTFAGRPMGQVPEDYDPAKPEPGGCDCSPPIG